MKRAARLSPPAAEPNPRPSVQRLFLSPYFVLYLCLAYFLVLAPFVRGLASPANLGNLGSNIWPLLTLVVGQMVVLIVAGIDLSQISTLALTSVVGGMIMSSELDPARFSRSPLWGCCLSADGGILADSRWAVPAAVAAMCLVGMLIGFLNGFSVARLKMPPFMVTLVAMIFLRGLAIFLTRSENIANLPGPFTGIGAGVTVGITTSIRFTIEPYTLLIAAAVAAAASFILSRTVLGRWLYAVGRNVKAARLSGVPTERVIIFAYMFSGFCAAVAAVLYSARLGYCAPRPPEGRLLDVIGAAVIGGISLFGGKGKVLWAFMGVLFFTVLGNSLSMLRLSFYTVDIVKGGVILLAASLDVARKRLLERGS